MLYGEETIWLANVKFALNYKEWMTKLNGKMMDTQAEGLFVKCSSTMGKSSEKGSEKNRSKSKGSLQSKFNIKNLIIVINLVITKMSVLD